MVAIGDDGDAGDGDDHGVAGADLEELLRPVGEPDLRGHDELVGLEGGLLGAEEEVGERDVPRLAVADRTTTVASRAASTGRVSPAGEAVARLPPSVPALRIWGEPTVRAAWASAGNQPASSGSSSWR